MILLLSSCSSYTPKGIETRYMKLSNDLDRLMDDRIEEKKRANLEKEFNKFYSGMKDYKENNLDEDTEYLDEYLKQSEIKIQYLKDLKDE